MQGLGELSPAFLLSGRLGENGKRQPPPESRRSAGMVTPSREGQSARFGDLHQCPNDCHCWAAFLPIELKSFSLKFKPPASHSLLDGGEEQLVAIFCV